MRKTTPQAEFTENGVTYFNALSKPPKDGQRVLLFNGNGFWKATYWAGSQEFMTQDLGSMTTMPANLYPIYTQPPQKPSKAAQRALGFDKKETARRVKAMPFEYM